MIHKEKKRKNGLYQKLLKMSLSMYVHNFSHEQRLQFSPWDKEKKKRQVKEQNRACIGKILVVSNTCQNSLQIRARSIQNVLSN